MAVDNMMRAAMQFATSCCTESMQLVDQPIAAACDRRDSAQRLKVFRYLRNQIELFIQY
jgi:hypothetical protein